MTLRRTFKILLASLQAGRMDRELDAEIAAHLELAEKEAREAGVEPAEARRMARIRFGGIESVKETHRDRRGAGWLDAFLRDLRHGFAAVLRDPGFAAVSIGVLALGIGANTAMFSLVDATMLKPLPFPHPERMVRVWEAPPDSINGFNTLDFLDWKRLNTVFEALSVRTQHEPGPDGRGRAPFVRTLCSFPRTTSRSSGSAQPWDHLHAGRGRARGGTRCRAQPFDLADALRRRSEHPWAVLPSGRPRAHRSS